MEREPRHLGPEVLYGEITRSAPGPQQLLLGLLDRRPRHDPDVERSSRAVSAMKMFSASESTHAITARARSIPADLRTSSSAASLSM